MSSLRTIASYVFFAPDLADKRRDGVCRVCTLSWFLLLTTGIFLVSYIWPEPGETERYGLGLGLLLLTAIFSCCV